MFLTGYPDVDLVGRASVQFVHGIPEHPFIGRVGFDVDAIGHAGDHRADGTGREGFREPFFRLLQRGARGLLGADVEHHQLQQALVLLGHDIGVEHDVQQLPVFADGLCALAVHPTVGLEAGPKGEEVVCIGPDPGRSVADQFVAGVAKQLHEGQVGIEHLLLAELLHQASRRVVAEEGHEARFTGAQVGLHSARLRQRRFQTFEGLSDAKAAVEHAHQNGEDHHHLDDPDRQPDVKRAPPDVTQLLQADEHGQRQRAVDARGDGGGARQERPGQHHGCHHRQHSRAAHAAVGQHGGGGAQQHDSHEQVRRQAHKAPVEQEPDQPHQSGQHQNDVADGCQSVA